MKPVKLTYSSHTINDLDVGNHHCCIYESEDEHKKMLSIFLSRGLERNEKVMYIIDAKCDKLKTNYLKDNGMDIEYYLKSGQLKILAAANVYKNNGGFDPDKIIDFFRNETDLALEEGYTALRITGEMSWVLEGATTSEQLLEYEAKMNEFFQNSKCLTICQYNVQNIDSKLLLDILATHPIVIIGSEVYDNYYYLKPTEFFKEDRPTTTLRNWLDNLQARKRVEDNLQHLSNAVSMSIDSIIISNLEGKILDVNDATLKMFEVEDRGDVVGKNFFSFITSEDQDKKLKDAEKILRTGNLKSQEFNIVAKDGNKTPVETNIDLMKNKEGKPIGFIGVTRDVTKRKLVEEKLRESEEKYRTLFNASPEVVALINLEGMILDCNEVVERITGLPKKNLIGKSLKELNLFNNDEISKLLDFFPKTTNDESDDTIDMTIRYGKEMGWMEVFPTIIKKDNKAHAIQLIARDVTERKRAEEEMKKKLMRFKLDDGNIYLVKEAMPSISLEAFKDLLKVGYNGLVVSRTPENDFKKITNKGDFEFLWLAEQEGENTIPPKFSELESKIKNISRQERRKKAILIDRLDYLIFKNGVKKTLSFVQRLRELAYLTNNIIIMSIDPSTLNHQELRLLEKEGAELEPRLDNRKIPDEQFKILRFIYENNIVGDKPTYTRIGAELGISKPTVRKRLRLLSAAAYVIEDVKGRNKVVELTLKGRNLFFK